MDQRRSAVGVDYDIRTQPENPTPTAVTVEAVGDQPKVSEHFIVDSGEDAAACGVMCRLVLRVEESKAAKNSADLKMQIAVTRLRIKGELGDNVGVKVRHTESRFAQIQLRAV